MASRPMPEIVPAGRGSRYAFALEAAGEGGLVRDRLLLFDLGPTPGVIVGEHDFGADDLGTPGAGDSRPRVSATFEAMSDTAEPLLLAEIEGRGRTLACGWWFERSRSRFVCAPSIGGPARYRLVDRDLFETWEAELPGDGGVPDVSGTSGRSLHLVGGRWREEDPFRCLGWSIEDALREAGAQGIASWQARGVQQRVAAAERAADALEPRTARSLLRDAVVIDGCDPNTWRLLGRLEFENGDAASAAPALAMALALRPNEPAALLDLADALAVLDSGSQAGSAALRRTTDTLRRRRETAAIVERGGRRGARGLAAACYRAFLGATTSDPRLEVARRHATEALASLEPKPRAAAVKTEAAPLPAPDRGTGGAVNAPGTLGPPSGPSSSRVAPAKSALGLELGDSAKPPALDSANGPATPASAPSASTPR
ncbi:MAG: hypothetical protein ACKO2K_14685 [Alphaproteobacteria bacterium]